MINLTSVSKTFTTDAETVQAVVDVTLSLGAGSIIALTGPSGSGKSTLLNLISGILLPDSGEINLDGMRVTQMSAPARDALRLERISLIFQDGNLLAEFSALDNVLIPLLARQMPYSVARTKALAALKAVGTEGLADRFPTHMSGGQRQRVGVARALAADHTIMLADEPTGSLDRANARQLWDQFTCLAHDRGYCIVVATHDPLAQEMADQVLWMQDGIVDEL